MPPFAPPLAPPLLAPPLAVGLWPFLSGWMLAWGLAAAIPLLLHLWNRRRRRETPWAAMQFLLAALQQRARRARFEQWLLVALRMLVLLLFAAALAEPYFPTGAALAGGPAGRGATHWVLVLDGSYSMARRRGDETRFAAAQDLAARLVQESPQGDGFTLVLLADPPEAVIREPAFEPNDVLEELQALAPRPTGAPLEPGLAEVERLVAGVAGRRSRLSQTRVCVFTDLDRSTWADVQSPACRRLLASLAEKASLTLFDVGDAETSNAAVVSLSLDDPAPTLAGPVRLEAEVRNFGPRDNQRRLEFLVDGRPVREERLTIPAGGAVSAVHSHRFETPGEHVVEVRLDEDQLAIDDRRWLAVPVRESLRVLCVRGSERDARRAALALSPRPGPLARVRTEIAAESALLERSLAEYDALVLCNVARFGPGEAEALARYAQQGGGLIVFLGDRVEIENYNRFLGGGVPQDVAAVGGAGAPVAAGPAGATGSGQLLPAKLLALSPTGEHRVNPLDYRHPIVTPFRGHENAGLLTTPVWRYVRLAPAADAGAETALAFANGDPLIVDGPAGRGRCVLFATSVSGDSQDRSTQPPTPWTALDAWPSFLPLMQETLSAAIRGRNARRNVLVGQPLEGALPAAAAGQAITAVDPRDRAERLAPFREGDDLRWTVEAAREVGVYRVRFGEGEAREELFAANLDPRESDLIRFDRELLPSQFTAEAEADAARPAAVAGSQGPELFRYALAGVGLLLLVETVLASWLGRSRA